MINNREQYGQFFSKSKESAYGKPVKMVQLIPEYVKSGSALDLGAGDGRHSLFLAAHGLQVKAIDTSDIGLDKLKQSADQMGVTVDTQVADLAQWSFDGAYDAIVATVIFQHLNTQDALRVLSDMKSHTRPQGVNAISLFTKSGDRYRIDQVEDPTAFYPEDGWLKEFYKDWEVLEFEEAEAPLIGKFRDDGTQMSNTVSRILARKP